MTAANIKYRLCLKDVSPEQWRAHREEETREIAEYTVSVVNSHSHGWAEAAPGCQHRWDCYQQIPPK